MTVRDPGGFMGVDTYVHLRVRDRAVLREALEAHATADRKSWVENGNEADYEELLAGGYSPTPLLRPLDDGNVSVFTGLRFHDPDLDFGIRSWLAEHFGDLLGRIHDDPRGVFATPDICEPRSKTYDGIVAELASVGRFVDPSAPTLEEIQERERELTEYMAGMEAVRAAHASGDEGAFIEALESVPSAVRETWTKAPNFSRVAPVLGGPLVLGEDGIARTEDGEPAPELAFDPATLERMRTAFGLSGDVGGGIEGLIDAMARAMERDVAAADADPRGFGRVSMLLPPSVMTALGEGVEDLASALDVQKRARLADGSVIFVTSMMRGEDSAVLEAAHVAEALAARRVNRAAIGALPFFRESLVNDIVASGAHDYEAARALVAARSEMLTLRTTDEWLADRRAASKAWLREDD